MHNVAPLVSAGRTRARRRSIPTTPRGWGSGDGGQAHGAVAVGAVTVPVEVTDGVRPGVVSIPHGWGHDPPGTRTNVASPRRVNSNVLADDLLSTRHRHGDPQRHPVTVTPAEETVAWTG